MPKVDRATRQARGQPAGHRQGDGARRWPASSHAKADDLEVHGLPGRRDQRAHRRPRERERARRLGRRASSGAGRSRSTGRSRSAASTSGALDSRITVRGVHVNRTDGVKATVRRRSPRHLRPEGVAGAARGDPAPDGRRDDRLARLHPAHHDEREPAVVRDAREAHRGRRVRPGARRPRARPARAVGGAHRHQEQPGRGAARDRLGHARGDRDQPARRPARRAPGAARRAAALPDERVRRARRRSSASTTRRASRRTSTSPPSPSTAATPTRAPGAAAGRGIAPAGRRRRRPGRRAAGRSGASRCTRTATPTTCAST